LALARPGFVVHRELVSADPRAARQGPPERALRAVTESALLGHDLDLPIESKLHAPGVRAEWVPRPGLLRRLAHAAPAKLILVDAPPGFGKTTLVAQWRSSAIERRRFAWLSLDPGDDDPGRLWWHVVSALERACPELAGQDIQRAGRLSCHPGAPLPRAAEVPAAASSAGRPHGAHHPV
jgi:hypothetical protein